MRHNMGTVDRVIRTGAAIVIGILLLTGQLSGTLGIIFGIVAIAFLLTSAIGWCPVYVPLGVSTKKKGH